MEILAHDRDPESNLLCREQEQDDEQQDVQITLNITRLIILPLSFTGGFTFPQEDRRPTTCIETYAYSTNFLQTLQEYPLI
jgi:hypothetical protein